MRLKQLVIVIVVLFVGGAFIAYRGIHADMSANAQTPVPRTKDSQEQIARLVREFLKGARTNDVAAHERFWADDLIYTSSAGAVRTRPEILKSVREVAAKPDPHEPKTTFSSEDMTIHDYGDFAVVNFRLAAQTQKNGKPETKYYRNTGTLRRVNGQWKVVAWQATRIENSANTR
jgi:ketosteroid isomerase-like protein